MTDLHTEIKELKALITAQQHNPPLKVIEEQDRPESVSSQ